MISWVKSKVCSINKLIHVHFRNERNHGDLVARWRDRDVEVEDGGNFVLHVYLPGGKFSPRF